MSTRFSRLALAALVLAAPVASFADTASNAAMDACLQSFLASDVAKDRKVTVRKNLDSIPRPLELASLFRIELVAKGRDSGKQIARVVCHANQKGTIVAVNGLPAKSVASVAAAR